MTADDSGSLLHGRYELLELAGDGGMAKVYRAVTVGAAGFRRPVAIKRVHEHLAANTEFVRMFIEEARVCSELDHPNIVQVHDFGVDTRGYYLVMEWVDGLHLAQYVQALHKRGERMSCRYAAAVGAQVLAGLTEAHERVGANDKPAPVIHRDVTPQNILLSVTGAAKLTDFGLARAMDRARMTNPNVVKGKLSYLAPELLLGAAASAQSDIYALGIVLWEALSGERLFAADTDIERIHKVQKAEVPPLVSLRSDLPSELLDIVGRALELEPAARFQSAEEMGRCLLRLLGREPVSARELGQSVSDARVSLGLSARTARPSQAFSKDAGGGVRQQRVVIIKNEDE